MTLAAIEKPQKKNVFEAILARHSVCAYAPDELDRNTIQTLLENVCDRPIVAPSGCNILLLRCPEPVIRNLNSGQIISSQHSRRWSGIYLRTNGKA
jgi:hypothetical protein